jgi:Cu-Zn family superoxide dismutase
MSQTRKNKKTQQIHRKKNQCIAVAVLRTDTVTGEVVVTQKGSGSLSVKASFSKLPPGQHGFHIHSEGDLRGEGCMGACSHFHKGAHASHGDAPGSKRQRHTGDLGNIEMPANGPFEKTYILRGVHIHDLWGRSIIVHADKDDLGLGEHDDSKTTGHSGGRIACAIFGRGTLKK